MSTFTVKPISKEKTKQPETIEDADAILLQAVVKYKELQAQITFLQNEIKAPRSIIEAAANAAQDHQVITPLFKVSLIEVERENFDKKSAIAALGRKTLKPFLSTTTFYQLRVS